MDTPQSCVTLSWKQAPPRIPECEQYHHEPAEEEAIQIYQSLLHGPSIDCGLGSESARIESAYTMERGISGNDLRDSFHVGSSLINDYGRPYGEGINTYHGD